MPHPPQASPSYAMAFIPPLLYVPALVAAWLLGCWLIKRVAFRRLRHWAAKTGGEWGDIVADSLSFPLNFLILASGLGLVVELLPSLPARLERVTMLALQGSVVIAVVLFADRLVVGVMNRNKKQRIFSSVSHGVTKGLVRGFVIGLGVLVMLDLMGISITPVLASLGIGSIAVALALQDTLSNFFAGLYVAIDKPVSEGDFVRLENGEEGYVTEVGWRSTRLRTMPNNMVVIPNKKLMESVITNYHLPDREVAVVVEMGVHYESDLGRVERVATEVAREVLARVPSGVAQFEPVARFNAFGDSSVNFSVVMRAKHVTESATIKHEFIKSVHERFRKEGIVIPYPTRTLELTDASAARLSGAAPRRP